MADTIPARLTAGDAWSWDMPETFSDYPSPYYVVSIVFAPENGGTVTVLTGEAEADTKEAFGPAARPRASTRRTKALPMGIAGLGFDCVLDARTTSQIRCSSKSP